MFDLLVDTEAEIAVPQLDITPSNCYTTTWKAYWASNHTDVVIDEGYFSMLTNTTSTYLNVSSSVTSLGSRA